MKFVCKNCGSEKFENVLCHGHKIRYQNAELVCIDCGDKPLTHKEIRECVPECCNMPMQPSVS